MDIWAAFKLIVILLTLGILFSRFIKFIGSKTLCFSQIRAMIRAIKAYYKNKYQPL